MPVVSDPISDRRVAMGRLAVVATVVAWLSYFIFWLTREFVDGGAVSTRSKVEAMIYLVVVTLLTASSLAYLVCRLGFFYRTREHARTPRAVIDQFFAESMPTMTVIVPSYREEERIIRCTLFSAALQEYPYLNVTLLIDDPPVANSARNRDLLETARRLPGEIEALLAVPSARFTEALELFENSTHHARPTGEHMDVLAGHFEYAVQWLSDLADETLIVDHSDVFYADHVIRGLASDFAMTGAALKAAAVEGATLSSERMLQFYRRLAWTFRARLTNFERKQYSNLSHDSNKAMNLNSYIGLMGGSYRDIDTVGGRVLLPASSAQRDLYVPEPDYVLTLDADSVLLPEYCLRLVYLMEQSQYQNVAVAQTPYSAFPGSATRLERIAGATTDIQHIVHQGMTYYGATFWVGANAVLRKRALDDVRETTHVGNWEIHRYIQDHTVIEDTESTIDLGLHGWTLLNYPERLSYSATPPDFGALAIQRRRWANGGLLILPKLRRQIKIRKSRGERSTFAESFLRLNYMASIGWSSLALVMLLAYPFNNALLLPLLALVPLPYFLAMANDLKSCGYKRLDIFRVYGLNLVLLPVNLAGVGNSIIQMIIGDKSVFGRTPKVSDRTIPNLLFIVSPYLMLGLAGFTLWRDLVGHRWDNGAYAALNSLLLCYAIVAYIGLRHSLTDTWFQLKARLYKPVKPVRQTGRMTPALGSGMQDLDWATVLHYGTIDASRRQTHVPTLTSPSTETKVLEAAVDSPAWIVGDVWHDDTDSSATRSFTWARRDVVFTTVFQSIWDLDTKTIVGFEAFSRFEDGRAPTDWLAEATARGSGLELELLLARAAISAAERLPDDAWVALNVSIEFVRSGTLLEQILDSSTRPVVLEIDGSELMGDDGKSVVSLRLPVGCRLSVSELSPSIDNAALVRSLRPAFAKLDRAWFESLEQSYASKDLIRSLVLAADAVGCTLITQGIETQDELDVLGDIGVTVGQGYYLGRPHQLTAG
jgi:EAL domain-containing protein (putative c-di-GMP-specific phosphodiesterase class I)/cellulose synthase/poly-beta-1,6-N-acetylglucosamine synthase-like glycosyltransferase